MISAVTHLCYWVVLLASITSDQIQIRPDLPVNFFPADSVGFSYKSYELLKVPVSIDHMLSAHLTICVDTLESFSACQNLSLFFRE